MSIPDEDLEKPTAGYYCYYSIFTEKIVFTDPKHHPVIKTSRSPGSHVCVVKQHFSFMFILTEVQSDCKRLTSGGLISREALIHHFNSGAGPARQQWYSLQ